jgi:hypothetical protein
MLISQKKFLAEASFEETKIVLGWVLNTRQLTIHLPKNKTIPMMHHFLSHLRSLRIANEQANNKIICIMGTILDDLSLCIKFLRWAVDSISLNLISFCQLSLFYQSDACPTGLGGYNIYSGRTWRLSDGTSNPDPALLTAARLC